MSHPRLIMVTFVDLERHRMSKQRYLRRDEHLDDDDLVVVRGGSLDAQVLRWDAERYHGIYGTYGLSVFVARDLSIDELAQAAPLVRFPELTVIRVGVLRASGFPLEPTGRNPSHFTVAFGDLDRGIFKLCRCEHRTWANPYHED